MLRKKFGMFDSAMGQSIAEYTMFITVIVMALLAMQVYLKRGIQGKIKDMADAISPESYVPNLTNSSYLSNHSIAYSTVYDHGVTTTYLLGEQTNRIGSENTTPEWVTP